MYYILKSKNNYDLYITYHTLLFFVIYKDRSFETSKIYIYKIENDFKPINIFINGMNKFQKKS